MSEIGKNELYTQLGLTRSQNTDTKANDELGQDQFLELMTAQLKYQDPLKPMENGEFLAQMAQFGTVSGINDLNTAFAGMSNAFQSNQALQASTMVGRQVLVPGTQVRLDDTGDMTAAVDLEQPASQVFMNITDTSGQLIHRIDLGHQPAGLLDVKWNGLNADGNRVNSGLYNISAEVHQGTDIIVGNTLAAVQVESVTIGQAGQDLTLTVSDMGDIDMAQIRKIM